jgi:hypothetical protein
MQVESCTYINIIYSISVFRCYTGYWFSQSLFTIVAGLLRLQVLNYTASSLYYLFKILIISDISVLY